MARLAVQAIQKMRGGAQSQLMLDSDCVLWVVKFQNNPQHLRILANEFIATRLAKAIGLSVPECDVIDVSSHLVAQTTDMSINLGQGRYEDYSPGLQFGSRFVGSIMPGRLIDYLPEDQLCEIRNIGEFAGILCLDKWLGNCDGRQAVFSRTMRQKRFSASFIDQGFCFNSGDWNFPDSPLRGVYGRNCVYSGVTGWENFEPWLTRIETISRDEIYGIVKSVPLEWYKGEVTGIKRLAEQVYDRRSRVRELIEDFRKSERQPFPKWV